MMQVTPISKTLAEVFRGTFLRIPRFQRPYSWDKENLSDFWFDLVDRGDEDYFMGSMVIFRDGKERNLFYVVDGQQRLTTITITLAVIRDAFDEIGEADLATGVHNLIEAKDLDNKARFVLEHDPKNSYFQSRIQQRKPDRETKADSPEQESLRDANAYIARMLKEHLERGASRESAQQKIETQKTKLKALRDRILALQFISIELVDEDDAYLIFETLNTRGKDLQISDLVKNLFTRLVKPETKGMDVAKDNWATVLKRFSDVSVPINPDDFLLHYWLATKAYVSKARLFKEMKSSIKASNAKDYLAKLVSASDTYAIIAAPLETRWAKEEKDLRDSLAALSVFHVAQALPLVLSIMQRYRSKTISLASAKKALKLIEKFTFQFNATTQSRGGGGVSNMYAKLAQSVSDCEDAQQFAVVLQDINRKLADRVPDFAEFSVAFRRFQFSSNFTRDRSLVRYILRKFSEHYGLPSEVDGNLYTIEHLQPDSSWNELEEMFGLGQLGNLLFVPESVNQELSTKPFEEKKAILLKHGVPMDPYLKNAEKWDYESIVERTEIMSAVAYEEIWKI